MKERNETIVGLLKELDLHRPGERGHAERVAVYSVATGLELGLSEEELLYLRYAATLHDVGKVRVDIDLVRKLGRLEEDELEAMRLHAELSLELLADIDWLAPCLPMIIHHHERWDGQGYPDGLEADEIPAAARIIAVCDAYGAITSERPYRAARDHAAACEELRSCAGAQFDPAVVDLLLAVLAEGAPHIQGPHAEPGAAGDEVDGAVLKTAAVARLAGYTGPAPVLDAGTRAELSVP